MGVEIKSAVEDFWRARGHGEYFPTANEDRLSLDEAYRIQLALIDRRVAADDRTSDPRRYKSSSASTSRCSAASFSRSRAATNCRPTCLIKPGFETELCMRFAHSLQGEVAPQQVMDALEGIHPSFEIIETRGDLTRHIALALADNAQQHSVILGPPRRPDASTRLDQVTAQVKLNGKEIVVGTGDAVLGNPLNSVVWLARKLTEFGRSIRAGDIVLTGSFVRQFPLAPGDHAEADFSGIGQVAVGVAP
jgi:2-keto-4-pentenoate hydratase